MVIYNLTLCANHTTNHTKAHHFRKLGSRCDSEREPGSPGSSFHCPCPFEKPFRELDALGTEVVKGQCWAPSLFCRIWHSCFSIVFSWGPSTCLLHVLVSFFFFSVLCFWWKQDESCAVNLNLVFVRFFHTSCLSQRSVNECLYCSPLFDADLIFLKAVVWGASICLSFLKLQRMTSAGEVQWRWDGYLPSCLDPTRPRLW